jgi:hypothetical protein
MLLFFDLGPRSEVPGYFFIPHPFPEWRVLDMASLAPWRLVIQEVG